MSSDDSDSSDCSVHDPNDSGPEPVRNQYGSCPVHAAARFACLRPSNAKNSTRTRIKTKIRQQKTSWMRQEQETTDGTRVARRDIA
jgi:hypothetical protein